MRVLAVFMYAYPNCIYVCVAWPDGTQEVPIKPIQLVGGASGSIYSDYLNKLTDRMPKVCKAVIATSRELFDESKVWRTRLLFQIKIIISDFVNVLTIFSINFATHLMNKSVSFHGKYEIVWVTPNFWTVVYIRKNNGEYSFWYCPQNWKGICPVSWLGSVAFLRSPATAAIICIQSKT